MGRAWLASFREVSFGLYSSLTRRIRFKALDTGATSGPSLKFSVFYPQPLDCRRMKGGSLGLLQPLRLGLWLKPGSKVCSPGKWATACGLCLLSHEVLHSLA